MSNLVKIKELAGDLSLSELQALEDHIYNLQIDKENEGKTKEVYVVSVQNWGKLRFKSQEERLKYLQKGIDERGVSLYTDKISKEEFDEIEWD